MRAGRSARPRSGQADQAAHEGWPEREAKIRKELEVLYAELASVAERLTDEVSAANHRPEVAAEPAIGYRS